MCPPVQRLCCYQERSADIKELAFCGFVSQTEVRHDGLCRYENMEQEEADQLRSLEIQSIRGGLGPGAGPQHATAGFGKLAGKMARKYGHKANTDFYEGQRWFNR